MTNPNLKLRTPEREILLFQESYVSIYYNKVDKWLYVKWQGERTIETLMRGAELMLHFAKETHSHKIINDSSNYKNIWPNVTEWMANDFAPRLSESGICYFAWIYDDKNLTKVAADEILKHEKSEMIIMVFDSIHTAEIWMRSIPN